MRKNERKFFIASCMLLVIVNGFISFFKSGTIESFIGGAIGASLVSIPVWSFIGVLLCNIGLFFYNIVNPDNSVDLGVWEKSGFGLLIASIMKPMFGIGF